MSLDHLIGEQPDRLRDCHAERLRRLEIADQLQRGWLTDREIAGLGPLQDAIDVRRGLTVEILELGAVADEGAELGPPAGVDDRSGSGSSRRGRGSAERARSWPHRPRSA